MVGNRTWLCVPQEMPRSLEQVSFVDAERHLEEWIELDPSLLGDGFVVVGRQVAFHGGPADLVAIDSAGRWVVVEVKRASNHRQDVVQALDYASSLRNEPAEVLRSRLIAGLAGKPHEEAAQRLIDTVLTEEGPLPREVAVMVVGVGLHSGVSRVMEFLSDHGIDVRIASFIAHRTRDGVVVLARDIEEERPSETSGIILESGSLDAILDRADGYGCGAAFRRWISIAQQAGLHARAYKHSVMVTPPHHHNAYLAVGRPMASGRMRLNHGPEAFAQWFPWLTTTQVEAAMGPSFPGIGEVLGEEELTAYLDRFESFAPVVANPPSDYVDIHDRTADWSRDRFLSVFAQRPHERALVEQLLDAADLHGNVTFARAPLGQARLSFAAGAPPVLQVSGTSVLHGYWAMGDFPSRHPGWEPLKTILRSLDGVLPTGGAKGVPLSRIATDQVAAIVEAARMASESLAKDRE